MSKTDVEVPSHEILIANSKAELQQCFDVRVEVFHHEQKFPLDSEFDDKEEISTHFLLRLTPSLKPIGTIRGYPVSGIIDTYKLTRLAVLQEYRKYGFGRKLVDALHTWAESHARSTSSSPLTAEGATAKCKIIAGGMQSNNTSNQSYTTQSPTRQIKIISHSQVYAKGFYSKFGYVPEGEEFIEDGDPHQKMVLRISISVQAQLTSPSR